MKDRFFSLLGTCGLALALATLLPPPAAYAWGSGSGGGGNPCVGTGCASKLEFGNRLCDGPQTDAACTDANNCSCRQISGNGEGCSCLPPNT